MDNNETIRDVPLDEHGKPKTDIFDSPMGAGRFDRGTTITDSLNTTKRTSNIMFGYNKDGIILENGTYLSWTEVAVALIEETTSGLRPNEYLAVRETKKEISPQEMVSDVKDLVLQMHSHLTYLEHSPLINQPAATIEVFEAGKDEPSKSGLLMLGKEGIQLTNGEYLPLEAIQDALSKYAIIGKPDDTVLPPVHEDVETKNELYRPLYNNKRTGIPAIVLTAAAVSTLVVSMFGHKTVKKTELTYHDTAAFDMTRNETIEETPTTPEELGWTVLTDFKTGEKIIAPAGTVFYASSDYFLGGDNTSGIIEDGGLRESGEYTLQYISVIYKDSIQRVAYNPGVDLADILKRESQRLNCSEAELIPVIHMGDEVCGWIRYDELMSNYLKAGFAPTIYVEKSVPITGEVDYTDTIKIDDGTGTGTEVEIKIVDDDGNLLEPGTEVIGSDGCKYTINELTKKSNPQEQVTEEEKLSFSVSNLTPQEKLAVAALGVAAALAFALEKKKKYTKTGMSDDEIATMFAEAQKAFNDLSETEKARRTIENIRGEEVPLSYGEEMKEEVKLGNIPVKDFLEESGLQDVPRTANGFEDYREEHFKQGPVDQGRKK